MLRIKKLSSYEEFRDIKEEWDGLISKANIDNIFLTHDWIGSYIRNYYDGDRLIILTVLDGDELVGIAPLMIRKYSFMGIVAKSVCFIGTAVSDRMDFILATPKEEYLLSIMDYLMDISAHWDFMDFQEIPGSSGAVEMIEKWLDLRKLKFISGPQERSFFIRLDRDVDFILKKVSKNFNRKMRKLDKKASIDLEFRRYMHDEVEESLFSDIQSIARRSWKAERDRSIFLKKSTRDLHREMFLKFAKSGHLDISILKTEATPIAYIYNFLYNNRLYNYSIEFDAKYSYISPGTMLMLWNIENSVSRGIREIDFCKGEEGWKTRLTQDFKMQTRMRIFSNKFYSRSLYFLCSGFEYIRENMKKNKTVHRILKKVKQRFI